MLLHGLRKRLPAAAVRAEQLAAQGGRQTGKLHVEVSIHQSLGLIKSKAYLALTR